MTRNSRSLLTFRAYEPEEKDFKYFSRTLALLLMTCPEIEIINDPQKCIQSDEKRECGLNLPYLHVVFDVVNASLELSLGSVHIWDHGGNVSYNGGKNQDAN